MKTGIKVYCHGQVVDVEARDGHLFCSCCGRNLDWVVTYLRRRDARRSQSRPTGLGRNTVSGAATA